jgi:hypothetical protein
MSRSRAGSEDAGRFHVQRAKGVMFPPPDRQALFTAIADTAHMEDLDLADSLQRAVTIEI